MDIDREEFGKADFSPKKFSDELFSRAGTAEIDETKRDLNKNLATT